MACEPNTLAEDAKCMCLSVDQHMQVQTFLLATLAGGSLDPNILAAQAAHLQGIHPGLLMSIKTLLLCQFLGEENGDGPTPPPPLPAGPGEGDWSLTLGEDFLFDIVASDDGSGFTHYCYRFKLNGGDWIAGDGPVPVDTPVGDLGEAGDDVEAQVRYCADGSGDPLSEWSESKFLTPCEGMVSVSNLDGAAERGGLPDGYIANFTWDSHPDQPIVNEFNLQRADAIGGPYVTVSFIVDPAATFLNDPGPLVPQTVYFYRVQTTFLNGCDPVNTDPFELDSGCHVETPTVGVDSTGSNSAIVNWQQATVDPVQEYVLNWGTTDGGPYPFGEGDIPPSTHEHEITGLDPETTYYFRVRAVDTETCFGTSDQGTFTTEPE